jgi:hypothetical protein
MQSRTKNGRGGPRAGSGRKPLPLAKKRKQRLMINLTDAEYRDLVRAAGDEPPSAFVRSVLLRYLARRRR